MNAIAEQERPEPEYTPENIDPFIVLGSIAGPTRTHEIYTVTAGSKRIPLTDHEHTQYVLIQGSDGELFFQRWNPHFHGPWQDIPQIGGTITELLEQLEGFGVEEETEAHQFRQIQREPGTARHQFESSEVVYRHKRAWPGFRLDHNGGKKFRENPDAKIPFPADSFKFDESRKTVQRVDKEEV